MGYQFFHIESYARVAGKDKAGKNNIHSVLNEATREINSCSHVKNPKEPKIIFGDIGKVEEEAISWAENSQDALGRKLRKDGHCLLAGVFSAPNDLSNEDWEAYKADSLIWLQNRFGDRLKCVLEHNDEAHRHCHFYCVPKLGERFEVLHDGKAAALAEKHEGKKKGEQNRAYCEAMRELQNDYFNSVSQIHKLTRFGPKKRRLTRSGWNAEKAQFKAIAEATKKARSEIGCATKQVELLKKERLKLQEEKQELLELQKQEESANELVESLRQNAIRLTNKLKALSQELSKEKELNDNLENTIKSLSQELNKYRLESENAKPKLSTTNPTTKEPEPAKPTGSSLKNWLHATKK